MRIVCLAENTSKGARFGAEHGLSLYIETAARKLLFDMGQTSLFIGNAAKLDVDLGTIDTAILSHGHYDHGGGLAAFLELNDHAPVYVSHYAFEPHFNGDKYIGLDTTLAENDRLCFTRGVHDLGDGITLYANAMEIGELAHGSAGLSAERDGVRCPDDFRHEQYLMIEEDGRRVLISGCSHRGILEITEHFRPDLLIGGFHVSKTEPQEVVQQYAASLNAYPTAYYTCHCTGIPQYEALSTAMPRLHYLAGGQELII